MARQQKKSWRRKPQVQPNIRPSLRDGLRIIRDLPGDRALLPPSPRGSYTREAWPRRREARTTRLRRPRRRCSSCIVIASIASPPHSGRRPGGSKARPERKCRRANHFFSRDQADGLAHQRWRTARGARAYRPCRLRSLGRRAHAAGPSLMPGTLATSRDKRHLRRVDELGKPP
jgi:hypothetical protein